MQRKKEGYKNDEDEINSLKDIFTMFNVNKYINR